MRREHVKTGDNRTHPSVDDNRAHTESFDNRLHVEADDRAHTEAFNDRLHVNTTDGPRSGGVTLPTLPDGFGFVLDDWNNYERDDSGEFIIAIGS